MQSRPFTCIFLLLLLLLQNLRRHIFGADCIRVLCQISTPQLNVILQFAEGLSDTIMGEVKCQGTGGDVNALQWQVFDMGEVRGQKMGYEGHLLGFRL